MPDIPEPMMATRKSVSGASSSLCPLGHPEVALEGQLLDQQREVVVDAVAGEPLDPAPQLGRPPAAGPASLPRSR